MSSIDDQQMGKTSKHYGSPSGSRRHQNRTDENGVNRDTIYLESDQHPVYRQRYIDLISPFCLLYEKLKHVLGAIHCVKIVFIQSFLVLIFPHLDESN